VQGPAIAALPYAMLAISVILTLLFRQVRPVALLPILGLTALAAALMLWVYTLHPAWRQRPAVMLAFFAALMVITATLVIRDPWFGFFSFTGYFFAASLPGRWRIPGVVSVAVITATSQAGGLPKLTAASLAIWGVVVCVNVSIGGGFFWFAWVSEQQNDWRKQTLAELAESNRKLEASLAENAGLHEQLLTQAREAGIMDERQRLAREIHDTLAQGLTGIITQLEAAAQLGTPAADRDRHATAAMRLARDSLSEARRSVHAMRPEPLEGARLPEALSEVTTRWSELNGISAEVTTTGTAVSLRPEAEAALLRTAQEALANVAKHAAATRVGLTLSYMDDEVALDVRDDGKGFDPGQAGSGTRAHPAEGTGGGRAAPFGGTVLEGGGEGPAAGNGHPPGAGFGLTAMRQRVEALAGTMEVESEPGGGTAVSVRIPAGPPGGRR